MAEDTALEDVAKTSTPDPTDEGSPGKSSEPDSKTTEAQTPESPAETVEKAEKQSRLNERFAEVTGERNALRVQNQQLLELQVQRQAPATVEKVAVMPQLSEFDHDVDKFQNAINVWNEGIVKSRVATEVTKLFDAKREEDRKAEVTRNWDEKAAKYAEKHDGYYLAVDGLLRNVEANLTQEMTAAILESEHGPALLNHLAEHPDESAKLSRKTRPQMEKALWKLEQDLANPPPPKQTSAPDPPDPLQGGSQPNQELSDLTGSPVDWMAQRRRDIAAKSQ